ncbi:hypothetical protein L1987_84153 [Smallanthus sonchifolius]|uniref:Uncharacterized protein n=1 Tax=Smallanthus sonchifolius TaxID=185202 RepID=A0ACB8YDA6_9ASTR|nr:hypothetical protein L1987_84153 [Smallanthus sonchifolius]
MKTCPVTLIGIPTILLVKFCSKALAKWILPISASALGIPVRSSRYVTALTSSSEVKKLNEVKQAGRYLQKMFFSGQESFDVDTGFLIHPKFLQSLSLRGPSSSNSGIDCSDRRLIFGSSWWFEQFEATILDIC